MHDHSTQQLSLDTCVARRVARCSAVVACAAILGAIAVRTSFVRKQARRLDLPSRQVELPPRLYGPDKLDDTCVWWLSATRIVAYEPSMSGWRFCLYDLRVQSEQPLDNLTRAFETSKGLPGSVSPSPSGHEVMWEVPAVRPGSKSYCVAQLIGSKLRYWNSKRDYVKWRADGMGWLAYSEEGAPRQADIYDIVSLRRTVSPPLAAQVHDSLGVIGYYNFVANGRVVFECSWNGGTQHLDTITIKTVDVLRGGVLCDQHAVVLPRNDSVDEVLVSPDGRLVAWQMTCQEDDVLYRFQDWMHIAVDTRRPLKVGLWMARTDGSHVHELATAATRNGEPPIAYPNLHICSWLPGNSGIVYVFNGRLYVMDLTSDSER